jgi:hypothetical protein
LESGHPVAHCFAPSFDLASSILIFPHHNYAIVRLISFYLISTNVDLKNLFHAQYSTMKESLSQPISTRYTLFTFDIYGNRSIPRHSGFLTREISSCTNSATIIGHHFRADSLGNIPNMPFLPPFLLDSSSPHPESVGSLTPNYRSTGESCPTPELQPSPSKATHSM